MGIVKLDFGESIDMLNARELREELATDRELRNVLTGIRQEEAFFPSGQILAQGTGAVFSTPVGMVSAGRMWAIMNVSAECAASTALRLWKGVPPGVVPAAGTGMGRSVASGTSNSQPNLQFSKGQFTLRTGEQITIILGSSTLLSVFISAISAPAERFGELLV
jgi:hypothetical protein